MASFGVHLNKTLAYNPRGNAVVERGHRALVASLRRLAHEKAKPWTELLAHVLMADRTTVRESTGCTPFLLMNGRECMLPVDVRESTWYKLAYQAADGSVDHVEAYLQEIEATREEARLRVIRMRSEARDKFNQDVDEIGLEVGGLVLLARSDFKGRHDVKMEVSWCGPFVVMEVGASWVKLTAAEGCNKEAPPGRVSLRHVKPYILHRV